MTIEQKQLVTSTVAVLKENGVLLTTHFYKRLFTFNPELKNVFNMGNQQNGKQQTALAMAVLAYAENIEDPSVLLPAVDKIGHKHTSLNIRPEDYAIVGRHLLASISEVLGAAATEPLLDAWAAAYNQLAQLMSGYEAKLYSNQAAQKGGWNGWRSFIVKDKITESTEITSFHLYPADGGPVSSHVPGQYLSVRLFIPELNLIQPRQYSISNSPNNLYYRISVKKETGRNTHPDGMISNRLHDFVNVGDTIDVTAPAGSFTLKTDSEKPLVFISGGVGQTPLISMLESLMDTESKRPLTWIHGCRNKEVHAFKESIDYWTLENPALENHIFYDILDDDQADNLYQGVVDLKQVKNDALSPDAEYYVCGPAPFIQNSLMI